MYYLNKIKKYFFKFFSVVVLTFFLEIIYVFGVQNIVAKLYNSYGLAASCMIVIVFQYFVCGFMMDLIRIIIFYVLAKVLPMCISEIKYNEFIKIFNLEIGFFFKNQESFIKESISSYADSLNIFFSFFTRLCLHPLFQILLSTIFIFYINAKCGLITIFILILMVITVYFFFPYQINANKKIQTNFLKQNKIISEFSRNILIAKIFQYETLELNKYKKELKEERDLTKKFLKVNYLNIFVLNLNCVIFITLIAFYTRNIEQLQMMKILTLTISVINGFWRLNASLITVIQNLSNLLSAEEKYGFDSKKSTSLNMSLPNKFQVHFMNITKAFDNDIFIKSINTSFNINENILIEGKSGSGKTTLFSLLLGIIQPTSGEIMIDKFNLKDINHKDWLNIFSYVPQMPILYDDTIKNNIVKGLDNYNEEDFQNVCKICLLDNFVYNYYNNYDFQVGINGNNLSGGQRQRVAIARALMRDYFDNNKKILCLDEAWSALSEEEAIKIATNLSKEIGKRGFIVIDHTKIWKNVCGNKINRIFYLENGILQEQI